MAAYSFNHFYYLDSAGGTGGWGTAPPGFSVTDGEGDSSFEAGDTLNDDYFVESGTYAGTVSLNGQTFVLSDLGGGGYAAYGNVPPGYVAVTSWDPGTINTAAFVVCFAEGTHILTDRGEVPVESLRAGDLVATLGQGGAPFAPVLFLGRRRIGLAGRPQADSLAPVRIQAGALGEHTPHRDLLVSPDHCLFLDGSLVPARLLVNGTSITVERGLAEVTYFHIELPAHDVVIAEGAAAESWLDAGNRAWFENAPQALLRVGGTLAEAAAAPMTPCAPLVQAGPRLADIRDRIAARVTMEMPRAA